MQNLTESAKHKSGQKPMLRARTGMNWADKSDIDKTKAFEQLTLAGGVFTDQTKQIISTSKGPSVADSVAGKASSEINKRRQNGPQNAVPTAENNPNMSKK